MLTNAVRQLQSDHTQTVTMNMWSIPEAGGMSNMASANANQFGKPQQIPMNSMYGQNLTVSVRNSLFKEQTDVGHRQLPAISGQVQV